jgi:hypothetical protein
MAIAFVVEKSTQMLFALKLKSLVGAGFTVTKTVEVLEVQAGEEVLTTCRVIVLTPAFPHAITCGPAVVVVNPPIQPSQLQLYTAPGCAFPTN